MQDQLGQQAWAKFGLRGIEATADLTQRLTARFDNHPVFAERDSYEFTNHASGPNMDQTPSDILRRIKAATGLALRAAFDIPDLDRQIKWHCNYTRHNGIHVSPTFMVRGLVAANLGRGDSIEDWQRAIQ